MASPPVTGSICPCTAVLWSGQTLAAPPVEGWSRHPVRLPSGYVKKAMENDPFVDGLPIKNGDFLLLC